MDWKTLNFCGRSKKVEKVTKEQKKNKNWMTMQFNLLWRRRFLGQLDDLNWLKSNSIGEEMFLEEQMGTKKMSGSQFHFLCWIVKWRIDKDTILFMNNDHWWSLDSSLNRWTISNAENGFNYVTRQFHQKYFRQQLNVYSIRYLRLDYGVYVCKQEMSEIRFLFRVHNNFIKLPKSYCK